MTVLLEPLELVSSQFFSAWVKDVQRQGRKKTFSAYEFHGCDSPGFVVCRHLNHCSRDMHEYN